ncbi:MAG: hypothetical protein NTX64_02400 [Elusimicrobia bacterium]|nr:hypothetical protein [Elusimicrobiota bacterium]
MKKNLILSAAFLALAAAPAHAKWWIFGKANEGVTIKYLYFNGVSVEEGGPKLTLYRSLLRGSGLRVTGRAVAGSGSIGYVRLSFDAKKTWLDAKLADDGTFEYVFTPEMDKSYEFYVEAADTAGKTNVVDSTRKELVFSDEDPAAQVRAALDKLIDAYQSKNVQRFMAFVSPDFTGDSVLLNRALQKDFSALDNINLRFSVTNIAAGDKGLIYVSLNFNRFVSLTRSGASSTDSGSTEFVFQPSASGLLVYRMKNPLMFGVSDPDNVAQGGTTGGGNLQLDDSGNSASIQSASIADHNNGNLQTFNFADGTVAEGASIVGLAYVVTVGDFAFNGVIVLKSGVQVQDLGAESITAVTSAPTTGYGSFAHSAVGHCFAFKLTNGKVGVIEITAIGPSGGDTKYDFKYRVF